MNMKKISALALSLILVISTITGITVFAESTAAWAYDNSTNTLTIKADTDNLTQENYNTAPWYAYKDETQNIIIQNGVTSIGDFSFCFESNLISVTIPDTLTSIGTGSFAGCDNLKQIILPDSIVSIGDYAFGYNSQMQLTPGFVAVCNANSYSQEYCFKNYIAFDTPISASGNTAVINSANSQYLMSFVPKTDCTIVFRSISDNDTYGLIYDAQTYEYSDNFLQLSESAIIKNDDADGNDDDNLNFSITASLSAGNRYYLAAKYKNPAATGSFDTEFSFTCTKHIYEETITVEPGCITEGNSVFTCIGCGASHNNRLDALGHDYNLSGFDGTSAKISCTRCDSEESINFMEHYHSSNEFLDVVPDSTINAKDYAKLMNEYH